jgi:hypothetical protein
VFLIDITNISIITGCKNSPINKLVSKTYSYYLVSTANLHVGSEEFRNLAMKITSTILIAHALFPVNKWSNESELC